MRGGPITVWQKAEIVLDSSHIIQREGNEATQKKEISEGNCSHEVKDLGV